MSAEPKLGRVIATAEELKAQMAEIRAEGERLTDNVNRANVRNDLDNLKIALEAEPRTRNYAVLIRRLIAKAAADALDGAQMTLGE